MSRLRYFTDEDIYGTVAIALRKSGLDAVSTPEVGRLGESDESQLAWASENGRVLITFNVAHFANLHRTWLAQGNHHSGIVVSSQRSIGDLLRRLLLLADVVSAEEMADRLEFLGDW